MSKSFARTKRPGTLDMLYLSRSSKLTELYVVYRRGTQPKKKCTLLKLKFNQPDFSIKHVALLGFSAAVYSL